MGHPAQVPIAEPCSQPQAPRFQQLPCTPGLAEQAPSGPEPLAKNQEGDKQPSQRFGPFTIPALGGETELGPAKSQGYLSSPDPTRGWQTARGQAARTR